MKTVERFQMALILVTLLLVSAVIVVGAYRHLVPVEAAVPAETVTLVAKRMSAAEKSAYDAEQAGFVQTVVISAPRVTRMTPEEKQAWLEQRQPPAQASLGARRPTVPTI